jgi:N6-adenosine-specific RNA methylase IME4
MVGVSVRSIADAAKVGAGKYKPLIKAVDDGKIAVSLAAKLVDQDEEIQAAAVAEPDRAVYLLKKKTRAEHEEALAHQIRALPTKKFGVILSDPAWKFIPFDDESGNERSASNHYATSRLDEIKSRDVESISADDCVLFMWATVPMLPQALEVMEHWGFCVGVGTRVLTADLRWVAAETLREGDALLGFDENPSSKGARRHYRWAQVTGNGVRKLPCYKIVLDDGRELISSDGHPWLISASTGLAGLRGAIGSGMQWCKTKDIKRTLEDPRRHSPVWLPQLAPVQTFDDSYASGFLAGAFDGEGSLRGGRRTAAASIAFAQRNNVMLEKVEALLSEKAFQHTRYAYARSPTCTLHLLGGKLEALRFLMQTRPPRLIANWHKRAPDWSVWNTPKAQIVKVDFIGERDCATLSTSTQTYIAEGFGAHNTYRSHFCWLKDQVGTGYWSRNVHELLLVGVRGRPPAPAPGTQYESAWDAPVGEHSEKPEFAYELIESYFPNLPRIELDARPPRRADWDVWGAEAPVDLDSAAAQ